MTGNSWFGSIAISLLVSFVVWILVGTNKHMRSQGNHRPNLGNAIGLGIRDILATLGGYIRLFAVAALFALIRVLSGPSPFNYVVRENLLRQPPNQTQHSYYIALLWLLTIVAVTGLIYWLSTKSDKSGNHAAH